MYVCIEYVYRSWSAVIVIILNDERLFLCYSCLTMHACLVRARSYDFTCCVARRERTVLARRSLSRILSGTYPEQSIEGQHLINQNHLSTISLSHLKKSLSLSINLKKKTKKIKKINKKLKNKKILPKF
jgi:hypothetical protein